MRGPRSKTNLNRATAKLFDTAISASAPTHSQRTGCLRIAQPQPDDGSAAVGAQGQGPVAGAQIERCRVGGRARGGFRRGTHAVAAGVFDAHTSGAPDDLSFDRTVVPAKLAVMGSESLLSRSQARRLVSRVTGFRVVELDFDGVAEIGQAFADELFRVFRNQQPGIVLQAVHCAPAVAAMIRRIEG